MIMLVCYLMEKEPIERNGDSTLKNEKEKVAFKPFLS